MNPKASSVGAIPCYPSVKALPGKVDLAVVLVPKQHVEAVVDDCAAAGVRALVVITAGFAETGEEGGERQDALLAKVRGHGMRMVGPNCMGLINADPEVRLAATFAPVFPPAGNVAMSSQSGALGLAILATAEEIGIGLSTFVSVGNKADVSANDLLLYWEGDEQTDVILLYVESFGNPRRFARIARRIGRTKPIVAVKSGRTGAGKRAAGSHTAALAESDVAVEALFRQTGALRAETLEEMFDLALVLGSQPLPRGNRVAILTNAGGPGILAADALEAHGMEITELSDAVRAQLAAFLPPEASTSNPVDMIAGAGASEFAQAAEVLLRAEEVDALIVIHAPIEASHLISVEDALHDVLARIEEDDHKPVLTCLMGAGGRGPARKLRRGVPSYAFPEAAARVLGRVHEYAAWRREPLGTVPDLEGFDLDAARAVCDRVLADRGTGWLLPDEVQALAEACGLPLLAGTVAATADGAVAAAEAHGYPVVAKLVSRTLVHKTDLGGVQLDLADAGAVRTAYDTIRGALEATHQLDAFEGRADPADARRRRRDHGRHDGGPRLRSLDRLRPRWHPRRGAGRRRLPRRAADRQGCARHGAWHPWAQAARGLPGPPAGRRAGPRRHAAPTLGLGRWRVGGRRPRHQPRVRAAAGRGLPHRRHADPRTEGMTWRSAIGVRARQPRN